jgi:hypothetical protein
MKTTFVFMLGLCLAIGAWAQSTETVTITPVKKGEEPQAVMNAIRNDFPQAIVTELGFLPTVLYGEQWNVRTDGVAAAKNADTQFYQVNIREGSDNYKALYDKDGNLHFSKRIIKHAELPQAVIDAVAAAHPDYKIINDREKITSDADGKLNIVYHVTIQKKEHGILRGMFIDPTGKVIREIHPRKL